MIGEWGLCRRSDRVFLLEGFLALDAARGLGRGLEPGGRNVHAAVVALAVGAGLDARQRGVDRRELDGFVSPMANSISFSVAIWAGDSSEWLKWAEAASTRPMSPPRCVAICASKAARMATSCCW